jgi:DNA-binding IclR family transcriptional regulator
VYEPRGAIGKAVLHILSEQSHVKAGSIADYVAEMTGCQRPSVFSVLMRLKRNGMVTRDNHAHYSLVKEDI